MCAVSDRLNDPLVEAFRVQSDAASLGFDWPDVAGVLAKVREETNEVEEALNDGLHEEARREVGDLFFSLVNLARFLDVDARRELASATSRFSARFEALKDRIRRSGRTVSECSLDELDCAWEHVKRASEGSG